MGTRYSDIAYVPACLGNAVIPSATSGALLHLLQDVALGGQKPSVSRRGLAHALASRSVHITACYGRELSGHAPLIKYGANAVLLAHAPCRSAVGARTLPSCSRTAGCSAQWNSCINGSRCGTTLQQDPFLDTLVCLVGTCSCALTCKHRATAVACYIHPFMQTFAEHVLNMLDDVIRYVGIPFVGPEILQSSRFLRSRPAVAGAGVYGMLAMAFGAFSGKGL